jgi:hypothetical protein
MKVELYSTFLTCPRDWFFTWLKLVAPPARAKRPQWKIALRYDFMIWCYTYIRDNASILKWPKWRTQATKSCLNLNIKHRIKISNNRATQRCNVSAFFYAKICSLLARRRSSRPVQRVYWPENVIDWLGKWRPTCVMRHARGQKLQSFRRKWPFYMDLYSMT